jgi:cytochrome o ubiquinol oxidase operon protein cyoD
VILTAIPFWLVMGKVFASSSTTAIVLLAFGRRADRGPHGLLPAHELEVGRRLEYAGSDVHGDAGCHRLTGSIWVMYHLNHNMMPGMTEATHAM